MMRFTFILAMAVAIFSMAMTEISIKKIKSLRLDSFMTEMNPDNNLPAKKDATASALTDIQQQINSITKNAALIFAAIFLCFCN